MSNDFGGKKRSELPDNVFGIPQERKYPMPDEKHTRSAIKLFNHVEPKYEEQLAKAIIKNMKKYNIDGSVVGPNNRLRKYLPKDMIKEGVEYIDYTLIKEAQPPYSAKNHRVYDGNLLKEAITEVINEKLNIFKKSSSDDRKYREAAYTKATSHIIKYLSKYRELRKGQVIYSSSNVHLDEYMNPKDKLQIYEDFMEGKRKSIAIYHNMIYTNYNSKGFDYVKENIIKPVEEMCDTFNSDGYELYASLNEQYTSLLVSLRIKSINESSNYSYTPQETGIDTIIFDIGDVLVSSNLKDYLLNDPEIPDEIVNELISLWILDKDDIDESLDLDTYRDISVKRLGPDFSKYIPALFRNNVDCVNAFDYTIPLIKDLKEKGYKVYYLSNWSAWTHDLLQEAGKFDFISFMDGGIFSHEVGCRKPDPEIYDIFIKKYKINPETSIFFDDKEKNIKAAKNFGIRGIQFTYQDPSIVYNAINTLKSIKEYYEVNILKYNTSIDNQYLISKEIMKIIKPVVLNDEKYKKQAKKLNLTLKCELLPIKGSVISVLVLDGSQEYRDTDEARSLLNDVKKSCVDALNKYKKVIMNKFIKKVTTGDGDEGCIYFHISKLKTIVHGIKGDVIREYYNEYPEFPLVFNYDSDNTSIDLQKSIYEASISEYGTTGGTIVGSNQPDSVYIVNYMQNNAFSGHKESKFGVCRKGMKDLHIVGGKYNRFHYVSDLDKFKEEASDIHVYRYKGKPKNEFFDIIEEMKDDNDLDLYKLITGREIKDRSEIRFDGDFIEEECFFDTIDAIKACTEAGLLEASTDLHPIPILTETVQGRPYNYYRDLNGVFIQHEITGLRSKSYETLDDIPEAEKDIVKRGYLV